MRSIADRLNKIYPFDEVVTYLQNHCKSSESINGESLIECAYLGHLTLSVCYSGPFCVKVKMSDSPLSDTGVVWKGGTLKGHPTEHIIDLGPGIYDLVKFELGENQPLCRRNGWVIKGDGCDDLRIMTYFMDGEHGDIFCGITSLPSNARIVIKESNIESFVMLLRGDLCALAKRDEAELILPPLNSKTQFKGEMSVAEALLHTPSKVKYSTVGWRGLWFRFKSVEICAGIALTMDIDPSDIDRDDISGMREILGSAIPQFIDRMRLLQNHLPMACSSGVIELVELAVFSKEMNWTVPAELSDLIRSSPIVEAVTYSANLENGEPWLIHCKNDPEPEYEWYTASRYFAREVHNANPRLKKSSPTSFHESVAQKLFDVGIKQRAKDPGKQRYSAGSIARSLRKINLSQK